MADSFRLNCPCCDAVLTVDPTNGEILHTQRPKPGSGKSFDSAMKEVRESQQKREDAFSKAFRKTKNADELLNKKFEEARKRAEEEPGDKPYNPMDLD